MQPPPATTTTEPPSMDSPPSSDDQAIQIACSFIVKSPPGEFTEVLDDIRIILNDDPQMLGQLGNAVEERNLLTMVPVDVMEGKKCLVTRFNKIEDGIFYDPQSNLQFNIDHFTLVDHNLLSILFIL